MNISSILCICTGNICRSPLAERLLVHCLPDARVASAGIGALEGEPMEPTAAAIATRESLSPEAHVGRQLTPSMVRQFELILVMEHGQKKWIESRYPQSAGRVFMMSHWQGGEDIKDPYRRSSEVFEAVYAELASCAQDWCKRLSS